MARALATHLMFDGVAEQAMNFYVSLFEDADVEEVERYGPGEAGPEGAVKLARFRIGTQQFLCIDSLVRHQFTFTPSISIHVECESDAEFDELYDVLSAGGEVLMASDDYGFSRRFGWVSDRYGVSWQLNLA